MTDLHFVVDTNVLISAFLVKDSIPRKALDLVNDIGHLVISSGTFAELVDVLHRSKFDRYLTRERRAEILATVMQYSVKVADAPLPGECRDPKDDVFLGVAIAARANCIVSGDQDLLVMNPYRGIPILSPAEFVERFGAGFNE